MKMRAILFDGKSSTLAADYPRPVPGPGEALVKVAMAGVCATDIEITKGYMGFTGVLGHEFTGSVVECADETLVGRRVTGEINIGCGACARCSEGLGNHCPARTVLGILGRDGAFADYLTLPAANLHTVPEGVSDEEAVFTEPLAAAFEITEQVKIVPGLKVCVLGDGRLGLLVSEVLALTGCDLTTVGRHPEKLALLDARGARTVVGTDGLRGEGGGFDVVVDATGGPEGLDEAIGLARPRGTVVIKTTVAGKTPFDVNRLVIDEITLVGSRCGPFAPAIEALAEGSVDVRPLVEKVFSIDQGPEAIEYASGTGVLKVLIRMD